VRELRNVLERAVLLGRPAHMLASLPAGPGGYAPGLDCGAPFETLAEVERRHIALALQRTGGNLARAARLLGVSLSTLKRRVRAGRAILNRQGQIGPGPAIRRSQSQ
jgi:DNA-binding NtrC family response regulator